MDINLRIMSQCSYIFKTVIPSFLWRDHTPSNASRVFVVDEYPLSEFGMIFPLKYRQKSFLSRFDYVSNVQRGGDVERIARHTFQSIYFIRETAVSEPQY